MGTADHDPRSWSGTADKIAIVGMSCRYQDANDVAAFWGNVRAGVESRTTFTEEELAAAGVPAHVRASERYVRARGVLDRAEWFDAEFFGMTPREAELTDPQHRVFLECCHEALEDAALDPVRFPGSIAVIAGAAPSSYFLYYIASRPDMLEAMGALPWIGNSEDHLTSRVSYKLGLRGPSVTVAAACATSLVAVHLGCQSLLSGESDAVLAGGVSIFFPQRRGYLWHEGDMQSPDGHCRTFDARAQGTFFSDGAGVVLLRRLDDALRDGDDVRAVILGSAVNNAGAQRIGYTAPGVEGQAQVVAEAIAVAGVDASSIQFIEAHGTATPLGDPIELTALGEVFAGVDGKTCAIGSVKTNLGHTDRAAGVAGLLKATMALREGEIPATLHFTEPNPKLGLDRLPFYVNTDLRPWPADRPGPRRSAVSSFGIGGTNAHVVLEQAPDAPAGPAGRPHQPLLLSGRTESAVTQVGRRLGRWLLDHPDADLGDVAYTLAVGRTAHEHRRALVAPDAREAARILLDEGRDGSVRAGRSAPLVVFMFSGQGAEYPGMGAALYHTEPAFRRAVDACARELAPVLGTDLRSVLVETGPGAEEALGRQSVVQPTLFVLGYALAQLWSELGVRPARVLGHSIGEFAAACVAGVFPLRDALHLVAARGALFDGLDAGAMLAVSLPDDKLAAALPAGVTLAAVNGPSSCVVSGPVAAVSDVRRALEARGVTCRTLVTNRAMHSPATDPLVPAFASRVAGAERRSPTVPFVSTVTGRRVDRELTDPAYWGRQLREPVRFREAVAGLGDGADVVLLEIGPGGTLARLAEACLGDGSAHRPVSSLGQPRTTSPTAGFAAAVGRLWAAGCPIDLAARFRGGRLRKLPLPTYPFERRRHMLELPVTAPAAEPPAPAEPAAPAAAGPDPHAGIMAEVEAEVVNAWRDLLGVEAIARDRSFFTWSDSLGANRLVARLRDLFGTEFPLARFYENPTVKGCVAMIREELAEDLAALGSERDG